MPRSIDWICITNWGITGPVIIISRLGMKAFQDTVGVRNHGR